MLAARRRVQGPLALDGPLGRGPACASNVTWVRVPPHAMVVLKIEGEGGGGGAGGGGAGEVLHTPRDVPVHVLRLDSMTWHTVVCRDIDVYMCRGGMWELWCVCTYRVCYRHLPLLSCNHHQVPTGPPPHPPRHGALCVYDPPHHRVLVFGGRLASGKRVNDVYSLHVGRWEWSKVVVHNSGPMPREGATGVVVRDVLV